MTGANVPNALIEVSSSQNTQTQVSNADGHGKANFDLPFGNYEVLVKSQGFCPFRRFLEPLALPSQIINVKLRIDQCPGPCEIGCVTVESIPGVQAAQAPRGPLPSSSPQMNVGQPSRALALRSSPHCPGNSMALGSELNYQYSWRSVLWPSIWRIHPLGDRRWVQEVVRAY